MKKITLYFLSTIWLAALFSSCAVQQTPQSRIEAYPDALKDQPEKHQVLIKQGKIQEGMSKTAVFLAWGKADKEIDLYKNNRLTTRWEYYTTTPVENHTIHGGIGFGGYSAGRHYPYSSRYYRYPYGYHGHRGYHSDYFGVGTGVRYQKVSSAHVEFEGEKVKSWQIER